jgi:hypothetical protein
LSAVRRGSIASQQRHWNEVRMEVAASACKVVTTKPWNGGRQLRYTQGFGVCFCFIKPLCCRSKTMTNPQL